MNTGRLGYEGNRKPPKLDLPRLGQVLATLGLPDVRFEIISGTDMLSRAERLKSRFMSAGETIREECTQRLGEVDGEFVEPDVTVAAHAERTPAIAQLDAWLKSDTRTLLVLGEFGCGKSTLLAKWSDRLWNQRDEGAAVRLPIFCNLAGTSTSADAQRLLLDAAGVKDTAANRQALALLIRMKRILPIFDGFDEMATRVTPSELAGRLTGLLAVAVDGGRVVISSGTTLTNKENLQTAWQRALNDALGQSAGTLRMMVQLFDERQVRELVTRVRGTQLAAGVLERIVHQYPLEELARRRCCWPWCCRPSTGPTRRPPSAAPICTKRTWTARSIRRIAASRSPPTTRRRGWPKSWPSGCGARGADGLHASRVRSFGTAGVVPRTAG